MSRLGQLSNSRILAKYGPRMGAEFEQYYLSRTSSPSDFFNRTKTSLYSEAMAESIDENECLSVTRKYLARAGNFSILNKMLYVDTNTWLPDELLVKADKMTMANSVELRVPFLDHKVLEFAAQLPRNQKVRGWSMKYLLKKALRGHVPDEILSRRKAGFPVPYDFWLRNSLKNWASEILLDRKTLSRGYFKLGAIEQLLQRNHNTGEHSKEIFSLVVLELWHRAFVDRPSYVADAIAPDHTLNPVGQGSL
jgi:asparagine synthase (glutamine-hydrolysing)